MTVAELVTSSIPVDHASPTLVGGYVMACSAFDE
jgi:hypothetical protein